MSLAQFGAFCVRTDITGVDILHPWVFTGMLFGAMMPYAFAAPAHVVEYTTTAPTVFYAAPALEVKYLAPVPLAHAAPVAAETVGFGSFPVEPIVLDDDFLLLLANDTFTQQQLTLMAALLPQMLPSRNLPPRLRLP